MVFQWFPMVLDWFFHFLLQVEGARDGGSGGMQSIRIAEIHCVYNVLLQYFKVNYAKLQSIRISTLRTPCRKYKFSQGFLMGCP